MLRYLYHVSWFNSRRRWGQIETLPRMVHGGDDHPVKEQRRAEASSMSM